MAWRPPEGGFDAGKHQDDGFKPLEGEFDLRIIEVEDGELSSGRGWSVNFKLEVVGPTRQGATIRQWCIVDHDSPDAKRIGLGKLSELSRAVGVPNWTNQNELVGRVGRAKCRKQKDSDYSEIAWWIIDGPLKGFSTANPAKGNVVNIPPSDSPYQQRADVPPPRDNDIPF